MSEHFMDEAWAEAGGAEFEVRMRIGQGLNM
jgi:hypothetical protein